MFHVQIIEVTKVPNVSKIIREKVSDWKFVPKSSLTMDLQCCKIRNLGIC